MKFPNLYSKTYGAKQKPYEFQYTSDMAATSGKPIIHHGKVVGGISTEESPKGVINLHNIEIHPKHRNKGIGRKTITELQRQGKTIRGYAESPEAEQFFRRIGAKVDEEGNFTLRPIKKNR